MVYGLRALRVKQRPGRGGLVHWLLLLYGALLLREGFLGFRGLGFSLGLLLVKII